MPQSRPCDACGAPTKEPRRGLCPACVAVEPDETLPVHGACASCGERRKILLRWTRLAAGRVLTCHNCGHVADVTRPLLADVEALRQRLAREQRSRRDRRQPGSPLLDPPGQGRRRRIRRVPDRFTVQPLRPATP